MSNYTEGATAALVGVAIASAFTGPVSWGSLLFVAALFVLADLGRNIPWHLVMPWRGKE